MELYNLYFCRMLWGRSNEGRAHGWNTHHALQRKETLTQFLEDIRFDNLNEINMTQARHLVDSCEYNIENWLVKKLKFFTYWATIHFQEGLWSVVLYMLIHVHTKKNYSIWETFSKQEYSDFWGWMPWIDHSSCKGSHLVEKIFCLYVTSL